MTAHTPTAAELARFDQIRALISDTLDCFIEAHLAALDEDRTVEVSIAGLAQYLHGHVNHHACAELLAVAVDRLASKENPHV